MAKTTIIFGILLIGLGMIGYAGGSQETTPADGTTAQSSEASTSQGPVAKKSITALIPALFGILLVSCGVLALKESLLKHAMHGAAVVGLFGVLAGSGRGLMGLGKFLSRDPSLNQRSFLFVWLMALICGVFLYLCVQSFIAARRRQAL